MTATAATATLDVPPGAAASEADLARAAVRGDGAAFAALYDRHERAAFNFCYRLTGSAEDAADAVQEAFVSVLERLPSLDADELNFGAYLMTTARHACYRTTERRGRAEPTDEIPEGAPMVAGGGGGGLGMPDPGDPGDDPERAALLAAQQEAVRNANARLPERQREVLALRELQELSYDEIAEIMDMNRNSVAQLISRARINLRDELRGETLAAIATRTPDCEHALPLIAMRHDGQLDDGADADWLTDHVRGCDTCAVSVEAMQEAGASYRAWLPLVPFAWLRMETIAKAAESVGADWSEVAARRPDGGASANGSSPGHAFVLDGPAIVLPGEHRPRHLSARERALRRAGAVSALTLALLLSLVALVVDDRAGDDQVAQQPAGSTAPGSAESGSTGGANTKSKGPSNGDGAANGGGPAVAGDNAGSTGSAAGGGGDSGGDRRSESKSSDKGSSEENTTSGREGTGGIENGGGSTPSGGGTPQSGSTPAAGPTPPTSEPTPPATGPPAPPGEPPPDPPRVPGR